SKFSASESKPDIDSSKMIAKVIYYILMVIVFIIFFNLLNLEIIAGPLADLISTFFDFIPAVLKAALILLVAFMVAYIARSAEHTSELQSRFDLVCRLLL